MESTLFNIGIWVIALIVDIIVTLVLIRRSRSAFGTKKNCPMILLLLNLLIFMACHVLFQMDLSLGSGVGLFAVLAMIRFRSEKLPLEQMILLLFILSMGFIHAAYPYVLNILELVLIDLLLIGTVEVIRRNGNSSRQYNITIDNLDLIKPENKADFIQFIESQTGHKVDKIKVRNIDIIKGKANISVGLGSRPAAKKKGFTKTRSWVRQRVASLF